MRKTGLSDTKKEKREKLLGQKRKKKNNKNKIEYEKNKNEIITAENEDMNYNYIFANDEKICFYQQVILL